MNAGDSENNCGRQPRKGIVPVIVLITISCLIPFFFNAYAYGEDRGTAFTVLSLLSSMALTLFLLTLSCRIRTLGLIVLPLVLGTALCCWYVYHVTGSFLTGALAASILETDMQEAAPYLTLGNISCAVGALALGVFIVLAGHKMISRKASTVLLVVSLVLFGVFAGVSYSIGKSWQREHSHLGINRLVGHSMLWPVYDIRAVIGHIKEYRRTAPKLYNGIVNLPSGYAPRPEGATPEEDDIIVVMMAGESVRAASLQINGYERETTPGLAAWQEKDQLVSFRNTCSFGVLTRICVVGLMTDAEIEGRTPHHRPWFDMLAQDGVETASVTVGGGTMDVFISRMTKACKHAYQIQPEDEPRHLHGSTVNEFRKALTELSSAPRSFFLLYDTGAHGPYISMPWNKKFLPEAEQQNSGTDPVQLRNCYDNTLLEVDWELNEMVQMLEETGRPAVFVYASDHGDALGENGYYFHGLLVEQVYRPAIFVWVSSAYKAKYPERYAALKSHVDKAVSHDHIMHTALSLCGVRLGIYNKDLDLTEPEIRETPVPEDISKLEQVQLPEEQDAQ